MLEETVAASFEFRDGVGCGRVNQVARGVEIVFLVAGLFFSEQGKQLFGNLHRLAQGVVLGGAGHNLGLQFPDADFEFLDAGKFLLAFGGDGRKSFLFLPFPLEGELFPRKPFLFGSSLALFRRFPLGFGALPGKFGLALEFLLTLPLGLGDSSRPGRGFGGLPPTQLFFFGGRGSFGRGFCRAFGSRRAGRKQQGKQGDQGMSPQFEYSGETVCHEFNQAPA